MCANDRNWIPTQYTRILMDLDVPISIYYDYVATSTFFLNLLSPRSQPLMNIFFLHLFLLFFFRLSFCMISLMFKIKTNPKQGSLNQYSRPTWGYRNTTTFEHSHATRQRNSEKE